MDARRIEDIWHYLYKGAYWRRGPVTMTAIGAIDMALWDIKGKCLDTPVYNLLGGRARDGVTVYGHANGATIAEAVEAAAGYVAAGLQGRSRAVGLPGLAQPYGVGRGDLFYEPAEIDLPIQETFDAGPYLRGVPQLFAAVRDAVGLGRRAAPRRAPPADAPRGGAARSGPRAASPVLAGGPGAGRAAGVAAPGPPAHHHPDRHRRGVQHDLRLQPV